VTFSAVVPHDAPLMSHLVVKPRMLGNVLACLASEPLVFVYSIENISGAAKSSPHRTFDSQARISEP